MNNGFVVVKFNKKRVIRGFIVQRGFIGCFLRGKLIAVSSGWCNGQPDEPTRRKYDPHTCAAVYHFTSDGWKMDWVYKDDKYFDRAEVLVANKVLERAYTFDANLSKWHIDYIRVFKKYLELEMEPMFEKLVGGFEKYYYDTHRDDEDYRSYQAEMYERFGDEYLEYLKEREIPWCAY